MWPIWPARPRCPRNGLPPAMMPADAGGEGYVDQIGTGPSHAKTPFCNGPGDAVIFKNDWPGKFGLKGVPDGKVVKTVH